MKGTEIAGTLNSVFLKVAVNMLKNGVDFMKKI